MVNYRHVYHAGNHSEILKHVVLVKVLSHLRRKETPFFVLDTHAGLGMYDLKSDEARKTGEAELGIGKVLNRDLPSAPEYLDLIRSMNMNGDLTSYPGSPVIIRVFLRQRDRLLACELHPQDGARLSSYFRKDQRVSVHIRNGYAAIKAFIPPPERRGLVFIDPPYENRSEFHDLQCALIEGSRRWPSGIFAAWYPIKSRIAIAEFKNSLRAANIPKCLSAELTLRPINETDLVGGGVVLINPPWRLDETVAKVGSEILAALDKPHGRISVDWLTSPR
jgi:23S rRNA (adenine2030-N6)-methyltransferase